MNDKILDTVLGELYNKIGTNSDIPGNDFLKSLDIENADMNTVRLLESEGYISINTIQGPP